MRACSQCWRQNMYELFSKYHISGALCEQPSTRRLLAALFHCFMAFLAAPLPFSVPTPRSASMPLKYPPLFQCAKIIFNASIPTSGLVEDGCLWVN